MYPNEIKELQKEQGRLAGAINKDIFHITPLGYKHENKKLVIDHTTKDIVIRIFELCKRLYQKIIPILKKNFRLKIRFNNI